MWSINNNLFLLSFQLSSSDQISEEKVRLADKKRLNLRLRLPASSSKNGPNILALFLITKDQVGPVWNWYGLLFQWSRLAEPVWDGRQARSAQISRKKTHAQRERERERDGELHLLHKMGNKNSCSFVQNSPARSTPF